MHRSNSYRALSAILFLAVCVACALGGCYAKRTLVLESPSRQTEPTRPALTAPASSTLGLTNPTPRADTEAREFLLAWHLDRGLPGLTKAAPGSLEETVRIHANEAGVSASRLFRFTPDKEDDHYFYALQHTDSGWQLTRAWKTDAGGKFLQQFEVQ